MSKKEPITIKIHGKELTIQQCAELLGEKENTIRQRIYRGWRPKEALRRRVKNPEKQIYHFKGEVKTLREWSKSLNIPYTTLYNRIHIYNWPPKKALSEEVK